MWWWLMQTFVAPEVGEIGNFTTHEVVMKFPASFNEIADMVVKNEEAPLQLCSIKDKINTKGLKPQRPN